MYSGIISKIEKAKRYAEEKGRVILEDLSATFRGDNDVHQVKFRSGKWSCTCSFFGPHGTCSHTMALERMLGMVPQEASEATAN
jgi:hypothetical protein